MRNAGAVIRDGLEMFSCRADALQSSLESYLLEQGSRGSR